MARARSTGARDLYRCKPGQYVRFHDGAMDILSGFIHLTVLCCVWARDGGHFTHSFRIDFPAEAQWFGAEWRGNLRFMGHVITVWWVILIVPQRPKLTPWHFAVG